MFDDEKDCLIDGDYYTMEGYAQKTLQSHDHLINAVDIEQNQLISARVSSQQSLLATDDVETVPNESPISENSPEALSNYGNDGCSFATLLTLIEGDYVGGNYDIGLDVEANNTFSKDTDNDLFQDLL